MHVLVVNSVEILLNYLSEQLQSVKEDLFEELEAAAKDNVCTILF